MVDRWGGIVVSTYRMRRIEEFLNPFFFFHLKYSKIEEGFGLPFRLLTGLVSH